MTDFHEQDEKLLADLARRMRRLDREIPIPDSIRSENLRKRLEGAEPPSLHVVHSGRWKSVLGVAAALALVIGGLRYLDGLGGLNASGSPDQSSPAAHFSAEYAEVEESAAAPTQGAVDAARMASAAPIQPGGVTEDSAETEKEAEVQSNALPKVPPNMGYRSARAGDKERELQAHVAALSAGYAADYQEVRARLKTLQDKNQHLRDDSPSADTAAPALEGGYSATNVQVEGIDEADIVKTDGSTLYYLHEDYQEGGSVISLVDAADLTVQSTIKVTDARPTELFLYEDQLVVMQEVSSFRAVPVYERKLFGIPFRAGELQSGATALAVYDVSDPSSPQYLRRFTQEGEYLTSRLSGGVLYLVTASPQLCNAHIGRVEDEMLVPAVSDSAQGGQLQAIPASAIYLSESARDDDFTVVSAVSLTDASSRTTKALLGGTDHVYLSGDALYLAGSQYDPETERQSTHLSKLILRDARIELAAEASLPGYLHNQFSMDQQDGYLRAATTESVPLTPSVTTESGGVVSHTPGERRTENHIYVLDSYLEQAGALEGLSPDESIQSVRFLGDTAYVVTYEQTDPLLVIDLSDPLAPRLAGELELPGYSTYLHPIDDHTLLGLGYDTEALPNGGAEMRGLKLTLFDVSDPTHPAELGSQRLGKAGSGSPALNNHKAFLYRSGDGLLVLPAQLTSADYESVRFDGLCLFRVEQSGIRYLGSVTQAADLSTEEYYASGRSIRRGVIVGERLFALSDAQVTAYELDTLELAGQVSL